ncbi:MAG: maleylpyruvate isomerase N-terminal domain-containing protein [Ilumatobacteraceae bacterium]
MDARGLERHIAGAEASHRTLLVMLERLLGDGQLDVAAPSRLPDWTVGHILTHLARNADGIVRVLVASEDGRTVDRYEGGGPGRNAEIEQGYRRPAAEQVDDVRRTTERLEQQWSGQVRWDGRSIETAGHEIPITELPFLRWREVEVHRVDLGVGYEPAQWPPGYVREELVLQEMRWNARRPMGLTGLPPAALRAAPAERLAWLLNRASIDGLDDAGPAA